MTETHHGSGNQREHLGELGYSLAFGLQAMLEIGSCHHGEVETFDSVGNPQACIHVVFNI